MTDLTLVIGNKNYSSWSLRAWIALRQAAIPFQEVLVPLFQDDFKARLLTYGGTGKVPILRHGDTVIWESLAILEYVAETFPEAQLLPSDATARAFARSVCSEMHAGFSALRNHMPMNIRKSLPGRGRGEGVDADIERICAVWTQCREKFGQGGPFLFGTFTIADAMYMPVVSRFKTYDVALDGIPAVYSETMLTLPSFVEWAQAGKDEPWIIEEDELDETATA